MIEPRLLFVALAVLACPGEAFAASVPPEGVRVSVRLFSRTTPSSAAVSIPTKGSFSCDGRPLSGPRVAVRAATDRELLDGKLLRFRVTDAAGELHLCANLSVSSADGVAVEADGEVRRVRRLVSLQQYGQSLGIFDMPDLVEYVERVVESEGASLPGEAVKAQAVVSRSWALAHLGRHGDFDFCDMTHCQLYRGSASPAVEAAVKATEGEVLESAGQLVPAFFHASCGGATSDSRDIFAEPGPRPVSDLRRDGRALCSGAASFEWSWDISAKELARALSLPPRGETRVVRKDAAGRALELLILGKPVRGPQLLADVTRRFGYQTLRSLKLAVETRGERLLFRGRGVGHGVGFCQAGAAALAKEGKSAEEILKHYFPQAALTKR